MRKALLSVLIAAAVAGLCSAAERQSWNKLRYIGGTPAIKGGSYDWDTTLTIPSSADAVEIAVEPSSAFGRKQTLRLKLSQLTSFVNGPGAWEKAAAVPGVQLPQKPHGLFGLLNRRYMVISPGEQPLAIFYQDDDGKSGVVLLSCDTRLDKAIGSALSDRTGKPLVYAK